MLISQKIQTLYPRGPYKLVGCSFGASIAFQMALQLQMQGHHVDNLVLLEGAPAYLPSLLEHHRGALTTGQDLEGKQDVLYLVLFAMEYLDMDYGKVL